MIAFLGSGLGRLLGGDVLVKLIEEYDKVWTSDWGEGWFLVDTPVGIITAFPCLENFSLSGA